MAMGETRNVCGQVLYGKSPNLPFNFAVNLKSRRKHMDGQGQQDEPD